MIEAKIIADSVNPDGNRITTWILTYPRFIHAEFMTHRLFSRNAASSRAMPIEKVIDLVQSNPAMPEFWGVNQKGMQAAEQLGGDALNLAKHIWLLCRDESIAMARRLLNLSLHKQIANRVLEPFHHITVLATATEHENFFALRAHPDAQPEFQVLAYRMLARYLENKPQRLDWGEWHIPFGDQMSSDLLLGDRLKVATARAARISYLTFEGQIDPQKDYQLHDKLMESGHWSPFEHCAYAVHPEENWADLANFRGWRQYRKLFAGEHRRGINLQEILTNRPEWVRLS